MTQSSQEPKKPHQHVKAGEINLSLIPQDWALTPLRDKKPYKPGWTQSPFTVEEIRGELEEGRATGVGLLSGQWSNEGGLVWVDIDGPSAIPALEELAGGPLDAIFPETLTISSGKEGRQRMLYSVPNHKIALMPNKATIKIGVPSFEILFRSRQGALMGSHPETEGYFTTRHGGFEFAKAPPEMPQWLYDAIEKAYPTTKYRKPVTSGLVTQHINISYEEGSTYQQEETVNEARIYLEHLSTERAIDYEEWLAVGMCLHQVDDCLFVDWVEWSQKAPNFEDGVCEAKWRSFERQPGGPSPEGSCGLHHLRAKAKEDGYIELGNYVVESPETLIKKAQEFFSERQDVMPEHEVEEAVLEQIMGFPDKGMRAEIGQKVKGQRRPKTPPASELAEFATEMVIQCGWRYDPKFETFMFYEKSRGVWRREEYKHEYKHFVQDLFVRERIPTPGGFHITPRFRRRHPDTGLHHPHLLG